MSDKLRGYQPKSIESPMTGFTFQQGLELHQLSGVIQLSEVFGLLRQVFPGEQGISLMCDDICSRRVEFWDEFGQIDICSIVSPMLPMCCAITLTSPCRYSTLEFVLCFRRATVAYYSGGLVLGGWEAICRGFVVTVICISRSRLVHSSVIGDNSKCIRLHKVVCYVHSWRHTPWHAVSMIRDSELL